MAVNEVNGTFTALSSILQSRSRNTDLLFASAPTIAATQDLNLPPEDTLLIQSQALLNATLQNLASNQQTELLFIEAFKNQNFTQQVELLSQSRLFLNDALQTLGSSPQSSLLIEAEALLEVTLQNLNSSRQAELLSQAEIQINAALQNLSPAQQAVILIRVEALINETFQNLSPPPQPIVLDETARSLLEPVNITSNLNISTLQDAPPGVTPTEATTLVDIQNQTQTQTIQAAIPPQDLAATTPTTATTFVDPEELIPQRPFQPLDPTPLGVAVYEVSRQNLTTLNPETPARTVLPTQPSAKAGPLDVLSFRPKWEKKKVSGRPIYIPQGEVSGEEGIRKILALFNEEQIINNIPIHLVLAENDEGLVLDIYDCSDNKVCQLVYDTPFAPNELPVFLNNLRRDAGFLVNTKI